MCMCASKHHHLRSRRQLVYAWGDSIPLPALESRMVVVQSLLLLLSKLVDQGAPELSTKGLALRTGVEADRCVQVQCHNQCCMPSSGLSRLRSEGLRSGSCDVNFKLANLNPATSGCHRPEA